MSLFAPERVKQSAKLFRFAVVGIMGTALYAVVVWISVVALHLHTILAASIGFGAVVFTNYVLHHRWTFRSKKSHRVAFVQFVVTSVIGFCINFCFIYVGVSRLHLNYLAVQAVALGLVVISNYLFSALWVFRLDPLSSPSFQTSPER